jgi:hypothetical protein
MLRPKCFFNLGILIAILFLLPNRHLFAQKGELRGKITDSKTGEALVGATVFLVDTDLGAASNVDGDYVIRNIPPDSYNIRISYIGYAPQILFNVVIRSEGNADINIPLESSDVNLDEV